MQCKMAAEYSIMILQINVITIIMLVCLSVRLSARLSVKHTVLTMFLSSHHHEMFRSDYHWRKWFPWKSSWSEVTIDESDFHEKFHVQKSKVKVTEVKTNFVPFLVFPNNNSGLNSQMATKWNTKLKVA